MSGTAIPLWKQELLKRRERNAKLVVKSENPHSPEATSNADNSEVSSHSHRFRRDVGNKTDIVHDAVDHKVNGFTKNGSNENRAFISKDNVDGFRNDTRRRSGDKSSRLSSPFVQSRLDSSIDSSTQARNRVGKYDRNDLKHDSANGKNMLGISRLDREYCEENVNRLNSIALDDADKERLKLLVDVDRGVDTEHIRPKDVKRMWKRQESREELYSDSQQNHPKRSNPANYIEKTRLVEVDRKQVGAQEGNTLGDHAQGNSSVVVGNVPKAYKSPYAKKQWIRQSNCSASEKPPEKGSTHGLHQMPNCNRPVKARKDTSQESNSFAEKGASEQKVEDDHIPSVKALLGLFGGRKANNSYKHDKLSRVSSDSEKQIVSEHPLSSISGNSDRGAPGLSRHHSEPNLYSTHKDTEDVFQSWPIGQSQNVIVSQSSEALVEPVPSHHVSHGIEERMSRLRRASLSSMEEMGVSVAEKNYGSAGCHGLVIITNEEITNEENEKQSVLRKKYKSSSNEVVASKNPGKDTSKDGSVDRRNLVSKPQQSIFVKESVGQVNRKEKSMSSGYVNGDKSIYKVSKQVNGSDNLNMNDTSPFERQEQLQEAPKQSFDQLRSVFGPKAGKSSTVAVSDTKGSKFLNKHVDKQSNYVVEGDQSQGGSQDKLVPTDNSKGINKNQHDNKMVIKIEESNDEVKEKAERKSRRSLLNVVDPLDVLQLTKDPVLTKGKPTSPDLGLIKETEFGRRPNVEIIKSQPDKKDKIAKINRAWDLNHVEPKLNNVEHTAKSNYVQPKLSTKPSLSNVSPPTMPANSSQDHAPEEKQQSKNIPVTSVDEIPVSSIDEVAEGERKSKVKKVNSNTKEVRVGNTSFCTGSLMSNSLDHEDETEEEFIPVSSIDDDPSLLVPPEVVFEKDPEKVKSCFMTGQTERKGNVSFFQHVFIHDYQSESAAASDWDHENGMAFSSYTPAAVKQYSEVDVGDRDHAPPVLPVDQTTPPEPPKNDKPTITYNDENSLDFTESSDNTAGALLF